MSNTYRISLGDTLGTLAARFYGSAAKYTLIATANRITNPDKLRVGQLLVIPDKAVGAVGAVGAVDRIATLNNQRLSQLHPIVAARGRSLIDLAAHAGFAVLVTQGLRSWKEQDALYARGRKTPPIGKAYIVTNAKGGQSWHNFGLAFDLVVLDSMGKATWDLKHPGWKAVGALGKSVGLEWGGDWKSLKDYPHFQYCGGVTLPQCCKLFDSGLKAVWVEVQ
jgi:hypothetical protein